jgi:hypothetical protein
MGDIVKMSLAGAGGLIAIYLLVFYSKGSVPLAQTSFSGAGTLIKDLQGR